MKNGVSGTFTSFFAALVLLEYTFLYFATLITLLTNILQSYKSYSLGETYSLSPKLVDLISNREGFAKLVILVRL